MKSHTKIALTFFVAAVSIILLLSVSIYYFSTSYLFADFYKRLEIRAVVNAKYTLEKETVTASAFREMREQYLEKLPQEKDWLFEIEPGKTYEAEADSTGLPAVFFTEAIANGSASYQEKNTFYRGLKYTSQDKRNYIVIVSADNYYYTHHLAYLRNILFVVIPLTSVLAWFVAVLFSRMVFNPVQQINKRVKEIGSENMHLRLDASSNNDEIGELITTFNNMLDRLETSFETQNNFISNASHELSTPITAIMGEADVALTKTRKPEEYEQSLRVVLNEAERLQGVTKSLLFLARTGFDGKKQAMDVVRTDQLLWDVKEVIDKINPRNQVYIDLSLIPENHQKLKIKGNAQLLQLALSNIVGNACKYSNNKPVRVSIGTSDESVIIIVKDEGIGIPEGEMPYIYDPFFRASNTRHFDGYGIGLPLARNIIRMHNGSLSVFSNVSEGTTVQLTFPVLDIMPTV